MCNSNDLQLKNIKLSLIAKTQVLQKKIKESLIIKFKKKSEKLLIIVNPKSEKFEFTTEISNFENISSNSLVITIYPKCKTLVNITGIKYYDDVSCVVRLVKKIFNCEIEEVNFDCAFYSVKNFNNYRLNAVYEILKRNKFMIVEYFPESFAGIVVKNCKKNSPLTLLIFRTGSVCMLGKITESCAKKLYNIITKILKKNG